MKLIVPRLSLRQIIFLLFTYMIPFLDCYHSLPDGFIQDLVAYIPPRVLTGTIITSATLAPYPQSWKGNVTSSHKPILLLASKDGKILILEMKKSKASWIPSSNVTILLDWKSRVCHNGSRWGIHSITVHPKFATTHPYLYLLYSSRKSSMDNCWEDSRSHVSEPINRVSRVAVTANPWTLTSEEILLELTSSWQTYVSSQTPQEGTLAFGKDGMLYVATTSYDANSTIDHTSSLQGKVLRIQDDGTIPKDNPYLSSLRTARPCGKQILSSTPTQFCSELFASGLHRPVTLAMDPDSNGTNVHFYILDRGSSMWEEIHRGGTDMPLANYGWPTREGPCQRGSFRKCFVSSKQPSKTEEPLYYYPHIRHVLLNGGVVDEVQPQKGELSTGVFVPQEAGWPSSYRFLFYDKVAETIFHLIPNTRQACPTCAPPIPAFSNATFSDAFHNVIDMSFFGQYKELYVTTCNNYNGCRLWNVRFKGNVNHHRLPVAAIQIQNRTGDHQETISFDAGNGTKNAVAYYWDFGDGLTSTRKRPMHTYKSIGNYPITLFIKDKDGIVTQDIYMIFVNWLLYVFILIPSWGGRFAVGQALSLVGGVDTPIGDFIPDSQLFWEVRLHRTLDNYFQYRTLYESTAGNYLKALPAPGPEDFLAAKNSYLEVLLTAVNKDGFTTTESVSIYPVLSDVLITSVPPGLEVLVDDYLVVTPKLITTWQNHTLRLEVMDQPPFVFQSWSDGGSRSRTYYVSTSARPNFPNPIISVTFTDTSKSLKTKTRDCSHSRLCALCEGHCQNDAECQGDLVCYHKGGRGRVVPGCVGMDQSNTDWCTYRNATSSVFLVPKTRDCSTSRPCGRCEGHCQSNSDCAGSLVCFHKGGRKKYVPGCYGLDESNTDWCTISSIRE